MIFRVIFDKVLAIIEMKLEIITKELNKINCKHKNISKVKADDSEINNNCDCCLFICKDCGKEFKW